VLLAMASAVATRLVKPVHAEKEVERADGEVVRALIGALKGASATEEDYRRHLEEKHR
jgi:hypothetical protein